MRTRRRFRYLNEKLVYMHEAKKKVQMVIGGILTTFFVFGIVETIIGEIEMKNIPVYVVFLIPSVYLLWCGIRTGMLINAARQYEMIFGYDDEGIITVEELSIQMGKPGYKTFRELKKVIQRGYLQNCTIRMGGHPCVVMDSVGYDEIYHGFNVSSTVEVHCSNCGTVNKIKIGESGTCQCCGAPIIGR